MTSILIGIFILFVVIAFSTFQEPVSDLTMGTMILSFVLLIIMFVMAKKTPSQQTFQEMNR